MFWPLLPCGRPAREELAGLTGIKAGGADINWTGRNLARKRLSLYIDKDDARHFVRYAAPNTKP